MTAEQIEEGKQRAEARRLTLTTEQCARVDEFVATVPDLLRLMFVGEEGKKKGYMPRCKVTEEEYAVYRAAHPGPYLFQEFFETR